MGAPAHKESSFSWDDYRSWDDGTQWQIIDGEAFAMTPAPMPRHQRIQQEIGWHLENYFRERPCDVFPAPTDVKLSERDVVQPDLSVVCDPDQVKRTHIEGPPTLVVEIISPSTVTLDRVRKMNLYDKAGVKEVWLVTPYPWLAEVFVLDGGSYRLAAAYEKDGLLESVTFPGLTVALTEVFTYPIDPSEKVDMVKEGRPPYGSREDA